MEKPVKRGMIAEFKKFLTEYKIFGLGIAFIMGTATHEIVRSLVNNIIMPLLDPLIKEGTWETSTLNIGPISLGWGPFLSSTLRFTILLTLVFIFVKKLIKTKDQKKGDVPQVQYSA